MYARVDLRAAGAKRTGEGSEAGVGVDAVLAAAAEEVVAGVEAAVAASQTDLVKCAVSTLEAGRSRASERMNNREKACLVSKCVHSADNIYCIHQ